MHFQQEQKIRIDHVYPNQTHWIQIKILNIITEG